MSENTWINGHDIPVELALIVTPPDAGLAILSNLGFQTDSPVEIAVLDVAVEYSLEGYEIAQHGQLGSLDCLILPNYISPVGRVADAVGDHPVTLVTWHIHASPIFAFMQGGYVARQFSPADDASGFGMPLPFEAGLPTQVTQPEVLLQALISSTGTPFTRQWLMEIERPLYGP